MIRYLAATFFGLILLALPLLVTAQTVPPTCPNDQWHPPGCGHEHGDAPPQWLEDFYATRLDVYPYLGTGVLYAGAFSTSAAENTLKHAGMKGYRLSPGFTDRLGQSIDGYVVLHTFSNPMDRSARFHSARVYIQDHAGGLTVRQGWVDYGDPATARVPKYCSLTGRPDFFDQTTGQAVPGGPCDGYNPFQRPIVFVIDDASRDGTYALASTDEQWYGVGAGVSIGVRFNATSRYQQGETAADVDPHVWHTQDMGMGQVRQLDLAAPRPVSYVRGLAWFATQFGEYVPSLSDPRCSGATVCLLQYVSPTYEGITGQRQVVYPLPADITLPN